MAPEVKYNEKLEVVTKEIEICKLLTSNDSKVRKRGIITLKKWFREIGQKEIVEEDDYNRIWNGLFYYVWMSDKPLVQEEAIECISGMIHLIGNYESTMYYVRGFFDALVKQWDRISHHRIDKFLMFVRRFLRQILVMLKNHEWNTEKLDKFSNELYTAMQILPYSLALHLNEIFTEEVAKVSKGKIPTDSLVLLLKGYVECVANLRPTMQVVNSIISNVFAGLTRQLKLYINQKALAGDGDNENEEHCEDCEKPEGALDPRPGGVDVILPFIEFDENIVIEFIEKYRSRPGLPLKAKNIFNQIINMFRSITRLSMSLSNAPKKNEVKKNEPEAIKRSKQIEEDKNEPLVIKRSKKIEAKKSEPEAIKGSDQIEEDENEPVATKRSEKTEEKKNEREVIEGSKQIEEDKNEPLVTKRSKKIEEKKSEPEAIKGSEQIEDENEPVVTKRSEKTEKKRNEPEVIEGSKQIEEDKNEPLMRKRTKKIEEKKIETGVGRKSLRIAKQQIATNTSEKIEEKKNEPVAIKRSKQIEEDKNEPVVTKRSKKVVEKKNEPEAVKGSKQIEEDENEPVMTKRNKKVVEKKNELEAVKGSKQIEEDENEPVVTKRSKKIEKKNEPKATKRSKITEEKKIETGVGRKSLRIAERQKKVQFNLEDNTFQDISMYQKYIKLRPEIPFDGSKPSTASILKPSAVSGPINPFYFPNGERKLKRKK